MSTKNIIIILIILAVLIIGYALLKPEPAELSPRETASALDTELEEIDLGDLDAEFEDIDKDLESL